MKTITNYDYLKQKIEKYLNDNKITLLDLAKKIGVSAKILKSSLNNEREFRLIEINKLQLILGINDKDLKKVFFTNKNISSSESDK